MSYYSHRTTVFLLSILLPLCIFGQSMKSRNSAYELFDETTGIENSALHYGVVYQEEHRSTKEFSKFFVKPEFTKGSLTFNGQAFSDLDLKYDVHSDEVLMKTQKKLGGRAIKLQKKRVAEFNLHGHRFINIDTVIRGIKAPLGYYEVVIESEHLSFLKKHQKLLSQRLGETLVYDEFETRPSLYLLDYGTTRYEVDQFKDVLKIFPEHEASLKIFFKNLDNGLSSDQKIEALFTYLHNQLGIKRSKKTGK